ncbi:MAG: hypothetical protein JSW73_03040 [Candidatus Woesearchaeota archaeon]|nr:MAG: hypothetical protein JSW73_03040 [Candidatus Woesearchaeota archaeon]
MIEATILIVLILLGIATVVVVWKKKKEGKPIEPDYRVFFFMGICFVGVGVAFASATNPGFIGIMVLGIVYMIIGLKHKDKWKVKK